MAIAEHPLPAQQHPNAARKAEGFVTPKQDKLPQCAKILPKRVLPIIFLPGIMGSNLRMTPQRQKELKQKDNIAWRPDILGGGNVYRNANISLADRQLRLDPLQTSVDVYDPSGPPDVSGDLRHANVVLDPNLNSPLLMNDGKNAKNGKTAVQKARARGWGEVFFKSYGQLLQHLEFRLNNTFLNGKVRAEWHDVVGIDPKAWNADPGLPQQALTEDELKSVAAGCWFAVYALGYNWLQSNGESAKIIAKRITQIMDDLSTSNYDCSQVIIVTHSMGGLVGRALVHPNFGNLQDKILGIVHGVMPAIGAPAAYKRMRAGFEDPGMMHTNTSLIEASVASKVIGNHGDEVTAVLANAQGGLELLPTEAYGNGWLRVTSNGRDLEIWPKKGDPYNEIYKIRGKWFALFREDWINPCGRSAQQGGGTFERTCEYIDKAQAFHQKIANTFHRNSYAHYGADRGQRSFSEVIWDIKNCPDPSGWRDWPVVSDTRQGRLDFTEPELNQAYDGGELPIGNSVTTYVYAELRPPAAPGDQTVPVKSADHQLRSGVFKGVFRQTGYEHQSSYKNSQAIASTLYSLIRISQNASWKCDRS